MAVFAGTAAAEQIIGGVEADQLLGLEGNDRLYGMAGNDVLYGGTGDDGMVGGVGDDTYEVDAAGDVAVELAGEGIDRVQASVSHHLGANIEILILTGSADINGIGNGLDNTVVGNAGANVLNGAGGEDVLIGGAGNDVYEVDSARDRVTEAAGEGDDRVRASVGHALGANIETLVLIGTADIDGFGNGLDNTIVGNAGANVLNGGAGNDVLIGGAGNDVYDVDSAGDQVVERAGEGYDRVRASVSFTLGANVEELDLGGAAGINGTGNALDNRIVGNAGANLLDGGAGADVLIGGAGDDIYLVNSAGDQVVEAGGQGTDLVRAWVSYALAGNVEILMLMGVGNIGGIGNAQGNTIFGNAGANGLDGGAGDDVLIGGAGNDTYYVNSANDQVVEATGGGADRVFASASHVLGANVEALTLTGFANISGTGNALDNVVVGNAGANALDGGAGNDVLMGGSGNDVYMVDSVGDRVVEAAGEGLDQVQASVSYRLGANIETLVLTGTAGISGTGNDLDNTITGNAGANVLNGGAGDDTLIGGAGDDIYIVDSSQDRVIEAADGGIDWVRCTDEYTLGDNEENLMLISNAVLSYLAGNILDNIIIGNSGFEWMEGGAGNDTLIGNAGDDLLRGGSGNDTMIGGVGDDRYDVESAGDQVKELAGEGIDLVHAFVNYALTANVENMILEGDGNINGTGNALSNTITGNFGSNILNGGASDDVLVGLDGDDVYEVGSAGDRVVEAAGEGNDRVRTSSSHQLEANVEILVLTGTADISGTGNALDNVIVGNAGANVLEGGVGFDTLIGGAGDDTYYVESGNDVLIEEANGGYDRVFCAGGIILGANIEELTLTGHLSANVRANAQDNIITGNDGANYLFGERGDDVLSGGGGADHLTGGAGADRFQYVSVSDGRDIIEDFSAAQGDKLVFQGLLHGAFSYLGAAAFTAGGNSEARFAAGQVLVDTDGNGAADITVVLTGITSASQLHASDFAFS